MTKREQGMCGRWAAAGLCALLVGLAGCGGVPVVTRAAVALGAEPTLVSATVAAAVGSVGNGLGDGTGVALGSTSIAVGLLTSVAMGATVTLTGVGSAPSATTARVPARVPPHPASPTSRAHSPAVAHRPHMPCSRFVIHSALGRYCRPAPSFQFPS